MKFWSDQHALDRFERSNMRLTKRAVELKTPSCRLHLPSAALISLFLFLKILPPVQMTAGTAVKTDIPPKINVEVPQPPDPFVNPPNRGPIIHPAAQAELNKLYACA